MAWTFNNVRIFVQDITGEGSQIIPRLQPVSGGTVLQFFGYENQVVSVRGMIVGNTDRDALRALKKTATAYTLVSPEGSLGTYYVKKVADKRLPIICQTFRPDLPEESPVYDVDLELYPTADI